MLKDKYTIVLSQDVYSDKRIERISPIISAEYNNYTHAHLFHLLNGIIKKYPKDDVTYISSNRNLDEEIRITPYINGKQLEIEKTRKLFTDITSRKMVNRFRDMRYTLFVVKDIIGVSDKEITLTEVYSCVSKMKDLNQSVLDPYLKGLYQQVHRFDYSTCDCGCGINRIELSTMIVTQADFIPYIRKILFSEERDIKAKELVTNVTTSIN